MGALCPILAFVLLTVCARCVGSLLQLILPIYEVRHHDADSVSTSQHWVTPADIARQSGCMKGCPMQTINPKSFFSRGWDMYQLGKTERAIFRYCERCNGITSIQRQWVFNGWKAAYDAEHFGQKQEDCGGR